MSPEFVAILRVGAFLLTVQLASTLWLANVIHSSFDAVRADMRSVRDGLRSDIPSPARRELGN